LRLARSRKSAAAEGAAAPSPPAVSRPGHELAFALGRIRGALVGTLIFGAMINILMLTGSFYMLEVYDRVLPGRSIPTLVALSIIATFLFAAQGLLDMLRARVLVRAGALLDETLSGRVFEIVTQLPLRRGPQADGLQPLRDLDNVRAVMSSQGPIALFDLPWAPIYMLVIFMFHPVLGWTALIGAVVLIAIALFAGWCTSGPVKDANDHAVARNGIADASRRNSEVMAALGMVKRVADRWAKANSDYLKTTQDASDVAGGFGATTKALRMMLQSAVLGVGAYLVIHGEATAGIIIAGSILSSRALAPVDQAIAGWKGMVAARQSWARLGRLLAEMPPEPEQIALPAPVASLTVENVSIAPPNVQAFIVHGADFAVQAGSALCVVGPSGSGKSSLARALVGAWPALRGQVRLDGAALSQFRASDRGRHIGYLPQDVELFNGTIAENISRFDPDAKDEAIVAAAKAAGVHELIVRMPQGYAARMGEGGAALSAGQRQRVALARALYGDPFLVVLDEPNSNLDGEGELALTRAIIGVRKRKGIVVIIAHRQAALEGCDLVAVVNEGRIVKFGPKAEVLASLRPPPPPPQPPGSGNPPLKIVPLS
jgi:ATP-binding cassette subfamily C protein